MALDTAGAQADSALAASVTSDSPLPESWFQRGAVEVHPAAALLPMMSEVELAALVEDIRENGLQVPIKLLDGAVLDGRNRLKACELAGVEPMFEEVDLTGADPVTHVISLNVTRRNLGRSQKAMIAAEAWDLFEVGQGNRTELVPGSGTSGKTRDHLATIFGVGKDAIQQARALVTRAPKLAMAVKDGRITLDTAYLALRNAENAKKSAEEEEEQLAFDLRAARTRLEKLASPDPNLNLLPAPDPDELARRMDVARTLERSLPQPPPEPKDLREQVRRLRAWDQTMNAANNVVKQIVALPEFPDDDEGGLVRLAALKIARMLADASARIAERVREP